MKHEISELSSNDGQCYYAEGFSPVVDMREGHGDWFCFEASFVDAAMILQGLGFTAQQILLAREIGEV